MTLNWQNSTSLVAVRNTAPRSWSEHYADVRRRLAVDYRRPNGAPIAPVVPVAVIAAPEITPAPKPPPPSPPEWVSNLKFVQRLVAHEFDLTPTELFYRSRAWRFLRARQVAQYLMHSVLKRSLTCVSVLRLRAHHGAEQFSQDRSVDSRAGPRRLCRARRTP